MKIIQANSSYENADNECSPPRKKNKRKEREHIRKEIHVNKWQLSDRDSTLNDPEDSGRPGNKKVK